MRMRKEQALWLARCRPVQCLSMSLRLWPPCFSSITAILLLKPVPFEDFVTQFFTMPQWHSSLLCHIDSWQWILLKIPSFPLLCHGPLVLLVVYKNEYKKDLAFWPISYSLKSCTPLASLHRGISVCFANLRWRTNLSFSFWCYLLHSCNLKLRMAKLMLVFPPRETLCSSYLPPVSQVYYLCLSPPTSPLDFGLFSTCPESQCPLLSTLVSPCFPFQQF